MINKNIIIVNSLIILFYFLWLIVISGMGSFLYKCFFHKQNSKPDTQIAIHFLGYGGITTIYLLSIIFNFFFPIKFLFSLIISFIGIFLFFLNYKLIFSLFKIIDIKSLILLLLCLSIFTLIPTGNGDSLTYHIPAIQWIQEYKVPLGLANLHGRLGLNSSWFNLEAVLSNFKFITETPYFLGNTIVLTIYLIPLFLSVNKPIKEFTISDFFIIFSIIPILTKLLPLLTSPSPDFSVAIFCFSIFYGMLRIIEIRINSHVYLYHFLILTALLFTIKLSGAIYLGLFIVYTIFLFLNNKRKKTFQTNFTLSKILPLWIIIIFIILPFLVKNFLLSGAPLYPSKIGYSHNIAWSVHPSQIEAEKNVIVAWTRKPGGSGNYLDTLIQGYPWFKIWILGFSVRNFYWYGIILISLLLFFLPINSTNNITYSKAYIIPLTVSIIGILFWFITAPDTRFVIGTLYSFPLILLSFGVDKVIKQNRPISRTVTIVICIFFMISGLFFSSKELSEKVILAFSETLDLIRVNKDKLLSIINYVGYFIFITGIILIFFRTFKKFFIIHKFHIYAILLILIIANIIINFKSINEECKIIPYTYKQYITKQGISIYSFPGVLENGFLYVYENPIHDYLRCYIPTLFTPYFYDTLVLENFQKNKRPLFRYSDEFANIDKYSFCFGAYCSQDFKKFLEK